MVGLGGATMGGMDYSPELANQICARIAAGESLLSICKLEGMPHRATVHEWVVANRDGFGDKYARAKDAGLDWLAEETIAIADTTEEGTRIKDGPKGVEVIIGDMTEHRRLRVDTRKWYLSKLAPKRYGERMHTELTGANGGPVKIDDATAVNKLAAIFNAVLATRQQDDGRDLV